MNKTIWLVIIVVVLVAILALLPSNKTASEVKLGVIAGTTGQYAPAGEGYVKGFNLAIEEWNKSNKPKFVATVEDDGFDAVKGLSAYKKLSGSDQVDAYAILSSFTIDAVYDQLHQEKKPVALGFEQSKPAEDDNIFQVLPAAKPVQFALGQKIKELEYKKPVAAVSNNTSVYQNFYAGFNDGYGGSAQKFDIGGDITGIRSQALAIVAAKPDAVAFFMAPKDGALLVKEILKITTENTRPYLVFDQSIQSGSTDYQTILASDFPKIDGSLVSMSKNDFTPGFIDSYKDKYNEAPPFGSDMGYNSFMLLANTYNADSQKWINSMKGARFIGADGEVSFDQTGLRVPNIFFGKLQSGKVIQ